MFIHLHLAYNLYFPIFYHYVLDFVSLGHISRQGAVGLNSAMSKLDMTEICSKYACIFICPLKSQNKYIIKREIQDYT